MSTPTLSPEPHDPENTHRQLLALFNTGKVFSASQDLDLVLKAIAREITHFFGVTGCALSEVKSDGALDLIAEYGPEGWWDGTPEEETYHLDDYPLSKKVITDQLAVQVTCSQPDLDPSERAYMEKNDLKTLVMLPMVYQERAVGLVEIMNDRFEQQHSANEVAIAQLLANQAASFIENNRLYERTQLQLREQIALRQAGMALSSSLNLNQVLTQLAEQLCEAIEATSAFISIFDTDASTATVVAEYFSQHATALERISDLGETYPEPMPEFLQSGTPDQYFMDDPKLDPDERAYLQEYGAQSVLIIPVQFDGQTVAYAEIWDTRRKRVFTPDEIQLCQRVAQLGVSALENARLYEETQKVSAALQESEARYELATRGANDGLWDWDLQADTIYFSPRWAAMLGFEESAIHENSEFWFNRVHPDDLRQLKMDLEAHLAGSTQHFENAHRMRHQDGSYCWVLTRGIAVRSEAEGVIRMAGSQTDITARKRAEDQLVHDAFHDALTGLPNRALFLDRVGRAIERTKRSEDNHFAVLFLDLDQFKVINDSLGHHTGDQLLIAVARRLEVYLRSVDTIARLGGDEFAILLEELEEAQCAVQVAARIQEELKIPFNLEDHQVFITGSIGIVHGSAEYDRPEDLIRDADIAMYQAKAQGRAQQQEFFKSMRSKAQARMELENELRRALGMGEFRVFYQPIIAFDTNQITGFEALVRWQHADRGLFNPAEFLSVAEETGLIIPLDWWVLQESCHALKKWQAQFPADPPLTISVNLSGKHFAYMDLFDQVSNILKATSLAPESLILEITENTIIENTLDATRLITRLRKLGVQVHIDDFGTGYSSLSYLQQYPIDALKIDRSFVSKMAAGNNHTEIVRTIVTLARELGMAAIAEGVETEAQKDQLSDLDCHFGQGYLIAKPMAGESVAQLLETNTVVALPKSP